MLIVYVNEYKHVYYFIVTKIIIDYEKQILITRIIKNQ